MYWSVWGTMDETTQHDNARRRKDVQRTHSNHVRHDHRRCIRVGYDGCERQRGLYTWQHCGSRCHTSDSGTTRPTSWHQVHPGYSQPAHTWQLMGLVLADVSTHWRVVAVETLYHTSPQHRLQQTIIHVAYSVYLHTTSVQQQHLSECSALAGSDAMAIAESEPITGV